jgi:CheY-like chemotaxis protein
MPNLNGLQLLQQIRSGGATTARDMRTVIITSRSDMETMGAAIALDVNGFLAKPFKPIPVIKTILKALIEDDIELRDQEAYCAVSTDLDQLDRIADTDEGASTDRQVEGATWYTIPSLRPEMTLAQDVRSETGVLLLSAGFVLNKRAISRLRELSDETGCEGCYIQNVEPPLEDSAQL